MPDDRRRRLVLQYAHFLEQLRSVRRAMADYFAGQQFFDFYINGEDEEPAIETARPESARAPAVARKQANGQKTPH